VQAGYSTTNRLGQEVDMGYNNVISSTDAGPLIPQEVSNEIIKSVADTGTIMRLAKRLPNMSAAQKRMPVMSALATAYFVNGAQGLKQTTKLDWTNKYIDAEEVAVIVPIPEAVLDDSQYPIWDEVKPQLIEACNVAIAQAVLYGTNIPASWTTNLGAAGIIAGALAASQNVSLAAYTDLYEAILGETDAGVTGLLGLLEDDGFMASAHLAHVSMRRKLRNARDQDGKPIFLPSMQARGQYDLDGAPCEFPLDGSLSSTYYLISGQWNQLVYSIRQDMTWKLLTEAVIQDANGVIIYNLAQQDMVALRAVIRLGFALPNPKNRMNETDATRFPFAYLTA
jgi:HK97 family phage major capsid protein